GSIAEVNLPSFPSANTAYNRRVLTGLSWAADNPYYYAGFSDAYCPDRVDHFIRDYPDDEGTEPSDASIPSYNKSNLWNRRAIGAGATNSDGSPDHQDPYCGATNYMYVKLEYVKPADAPSEPGPRNGNATVEIYLGEPGASTSLQPIASPNQISFPPGSSYVDTRYLVWNSPPGLPPHCCAFAIAYSDVVEDGVTYGEPRPFLVGTDPTWAQVHSIRNLSNDIAQRNLNFLDCAKDDTTDDLDGDAEAGEAERVAFPWVQAANIVAKEETAFTLQVDPHPDLSPLVLELNGEIVGPLDGRIELPPLAHNKHVVIRLHTTVPSRGRLGQTFPVNMTFLHDGEPFGGYEHVLRIATLEQTTPQVLSALFAALRDLSIAADAVEAWELAQKVQQLVWKGVILPDNWSLIEKLYGHKRGDLLVELRALADDFTALGRSLSERKWGTAVQRHVVALGKLMNQRAKSPAQFLERLRELADRIQEPAGYVVRRTRRAHRRVRFVLKRIKVLDDKETWFPSPGELIFNVAIIPDGNLDKAVCRRVPTEGYISLRDGESKNFDFVLFDGYVEDGTILDVSMGGAEMDNLLFFTKKNPLTRYRRRFIDDTLSWAGAYTPEDEPDDPEALYDWQLWYEVEVM
ncbi:MAG: hypothetical protein GY803_15520, partial [Chloroflexi bacterium]|nr:hypothetical protein [Chloroflexota bacterium]